MQAVSGWAETRVATILRVGSPEEHAFGSTPRDGK